jgi:hypothetical protein
MSKATCGDQQMGITDVLPSFTNPNTKPICKCKDIFKEAINKTLAKASLLRTSRDYGPAEPGSLYAVSMPNGAREESRTCAYGTMYCSWIHRIEYLRLFACVRHPEIRQSRDSLAGSYSGCDAISTHRTLHRPSSSDLAAYQSCCLQFS